MRAVVDRLVKNEGTLARAYGLAVIIALVESALVAPAGWRLIAASVAAGMLAVGLALVLLVVGMQVGVNPFWGEGLTRFFMGVVMLVSPPMIAAALVLYPFAPNELRDLGNGAATGWVGFAWGAHFFFHRHGLKEPYSILSFWRGPSQHEPTPRGGLRAVLARACRAYAITAPIVIGGMLVRSLVLYDGTVPMALPFLAVAGALFVGCLAYGVLTSGNTGGPMEVLAWVVAGAVSLDAMVGFVFLAMPPDVGDQALASTVEFWMFWSIAGGITGFAYRMIAQGSR